MEDFIHMSHSIGNNVHHMEWCTKYRYKMLGKTSSMASLRRILTDMAKTHGIKIVEMAIQPEHVHMIVQLHPSMSQSKAIQLLKGGSSYQMFKEHPNMRKRYPRGHLWSGGNFKDSVGRNLRNVVEKYVRDQDLSSQPTLNSFV